MLTIGEKRSKDFNVQTFLIFTVSFTLHATCMQFISTDIHAQEMKVKVDVLKQNILVHVYSVLVAK